MKTIRIAGWAGMVGLVSAALACCGAMAQTQNSLKFRDADNLGNADSLRHPDQEPSSSGPATAVVITPELRADMFEAHGQYEAAIDAYRKIEPQTAEIYNKMGIAYQRLAMQPEAIDSYDRAFHMDHKFAAAYNNLGTVYFQQKDNKRAQKLYKHSIKLKEDAAPFWSNLGAVYLAERKYSDGAEAYEKAFKLNPDIFEELELNGVQQVETPQELAKMYLTFAEIYAHAGMKQQAILYLRKALSEGFRDAQKLAQDQQLATLHGDPEFEQMVAARHQM